jgi:hypothetical protein
MHAILAGIPQSLRPAVLIASTCAVLLLATALLLPRAPPPAPLLTTDAHTDADAVRLDARVTRRNGNEVLWQLPPPSSPLRAALFAAPGCTIRATDFFDASPGCPRCTGLPEERRFTRAALSRGYAVLAVSSRAECWSLDDGGGGDGEDSSELAAVQSIIKWWTTEKYPQLAGLPLVGIGASSGGYFLSALAATVKFSSVAVMIAEGVYGAMAEIPTGYPPALFVHMPKDTERAQLVADSMGRLREKHVDVREIRCDDFAVSAEFLAGRVPTLWWTCFSGRESWMRRGSSRRTGGEHCGRRRLRRPRCCLRGSVWRDMSPRSSMLPMRTMSSPA